MNERPIIELFNFLKIVEKSIPVVAPVVSFHNELMSPRHQGQSVRMVERLRNVLKYFQR
jgi:hypothetical protein